MTSNNSLLVGAIMPHPPIVVPEVGGNRIKEAQQTVSALDKIAKIVNSKHPETVVIITPHGANSSASIPIYTGHIFEGDFGSFGAPKVRLSFKGDAELAIKIVKENQNTSRTPETILDHGALVPLYYLHKHGFKKSILPIAIAYTSLQKLFEFGQSLARTAKSLNRKIAIVASADMSHRLTKDSPAGYNPRGEEFDRKLVEIVKNYSVNELLSFDPILADIAGQDALWSIAILLGALSETRISHNLISYEGPFGVGYMVASFEPIC